MKVTLIQPNCAPEVARDHLSLQYPINLGYIAAALAEAGHRVSLLDFNVMDPHRLGHHLARLQPDVVGLTAMSSSFYNARDIIHQTRRLRPDARILMGGVHATALPEQTLRDVPEIDYLVLGEGERTVVELLDRLDKPAQVRGIAYRRDGVVASTPPRELIEDLDSIPPPDRSLVPMRLYRERHVSRGFSRRDQAIIEIMTARGCPYRCIFCAGHQAYGRRVRFRSLENIAAEVDAAMEGHGVTHVSIEDDSFGLQRDLAEGLCDYFKARGLTWNCNGHVNVLNETLIQRMASSGCRKIAFGIESGSPRLLRQLRKGITVERAVATVHAARRAGVRYIECDFMLGAHPDETPADVAATERLIYRLMPDFLIVSIMCPYPGTEVHRIMEERGYLGRPDWSQYSHFGALRRYRRITHFSPDEVFALQHRLLRDYYSSPRYVASQLLRTRSLTEVKYLTRLGLAFVREFLLPGAKRRAG